MEGRALSDGPRRNQAGIGELRTERMGASHFESLAQQSGCGLSGFMTRGMRLLMERFVMTSCSSAPTKSRWILGWQLGRSGFNSFVLPTSNRRVFNRPKNSIDLITNQRERELQLSWETRSGGSKLLRKPWTKKKKLLRVVNSACC